MSVHHLSQGRPQSLRSTASSLGWNPWAGLGLAAWLLLGCAAPPPALLAGADPAEAGAPVRAATYRSSVGAYVRQRPVEPKAWGEQNQGVAPTPRSGH